MAAVSAELRSQIIGGRIQAIRQHNDTDLTFEIRNRGENFFLFVSVHPRFSRIHLTASRRAVPKQALNFCMLLRKHVDGSFITSIKQIGFDRVLHIETESSDGRHATLILEIMGKHSNLILVSDENRVLGAAKNIPASVSRARQILPGRDYMPPPGIEKADPLKVSRPLFDSLWVQGMEEGYTRDHVKHWLVAVFSGIGPFLADEIVLRATDDTLDAVWNALISVRETVTSNSYDPVLVTNERGAAVYAYPIPALQYPESQRHPRASINEVLDTLYRDLINRSDFDAEYSSLEGAIKKSIAYRAQMMRDLTKAVSEGDRAERYKELGELVLASQYTIEKGQSSCEVIDYYDPEMKPVVVTLDPKLTPLENADKYFRKFRKARDAASVAADRIEDNRTELATLQQALETLRAAKSVDTLKSLRKDLTAQGLLRPEPKLPVSGRREEPEFGGARIKRVVSADGYEILYGENSTSNDYLTGKIAKPNDLWFHARSVTGAHVVIRTGGKQSNVPPGTIRQAAEIAALNSDAKHSSLVAVDYTHKKFVRKPRGSAPGFVTYQREKTLDVTPTMR